MRRALAGGAGGGCIKPAVAALAYARHLEAYTRQLAPKRQRLSAAETVPEPQLEPQLEQQLEQRALSDYNAPAVNA